ncbi:protocadherin Fat 4-like [Branchiostoma floridae x Branchiostoma belcheri]
MTTAAGGMTTAAGGLTTTWLPTTTDETTTETTLFQSTVPFPEETCPPDNSMKNITLWPVCTSRYFRFNATENTASELVGRIEDPLPADVEVLTSNFTIGDDDDASSYFMLANCTNSSCDIVTARSLDRESRATFTFEVLWSREVYFTGTRVILQDCSSIPVEVNVNDVNDNPPVFKHSAIAPYVLDESPPGSIVAVLSAEDADIGQNAAVTYSIAPSHAEYFSVDSEGVVTASRQVSQDELRQSGLLNGVELLLHVVASDGLFAAHANVSFDVLTVLPDGPTLNRSEPVEVTVPEEQPPGTFVVNLRTDRPSDPPTVVYSIANTARGFQLDSSSGEIRTTEALDRETKSSHYIVISASDPDSGNYVASVVTEVTVVVGDVNDNSPVLSQTRYRGRVPENVGQLVILDGIGIAASDDDIGENSRITYELHCCHDLFRIDPVTAEIWAQNSSLLDRENVAVYDLIVTARDNPVDSSLHRESNATVTINIVDMNDNRPIFQNGSHLNISIPEDKSPGFALFTVTATDADLGTNSSIFYTITSGGDGKFTISPTTGRLSLAGELDREAKSMYSIAIAASDGGSPPLTSEEEFQMQVTVLDVNDNEPEFPQSIYYITIDEESVIGSNIANITALDADEGSNGQVRYAISNCAPHFSIDSATGSMYVQSRLDYDNTALLRSYSCNVNGTDGKYTSTALVQVEVEDINDNPPEFGAEGGYSTQILYNEDQALPAIVAAVDATDKDSGRNGDIVFSILNTSCDVNVTATFTVDGSTGIIRLDGIQVQDQSLPAWCNITVIATDQGVPSLNSTATVSVEITEPKGDTSKVTFGDNTAFSGFVVENLAKEQYIVQVNATAAGTDCEATLRYKFASWQTVDFEFAINETTGDVTSKSVTFDRELKATYAFAVVAENTCTDDGKRRFDYTSVIVHVNDTNDEKPTFSRSTYKMEVEEEMSGLVVGRVSAEDRDEGSNGAISYRIVGGDVGEVFVIDANGTISTSKALDREKIGEYQINVMASDGGQPAQSSTCGVNITVLDINDNPPVFNESSSAVVVPEDLARFSTLNVTVRATDKDEDEDPITNGRVTYSLMGEGWQTFKIEENTGTIELDQQLDYENITSYNLSVVAKDGGQPPRNSSVQLLITVTDVNDNEPLFERDDYNASVPRNVGTDVAVVNVSATDGDSGQNGAVWYNITSLYAAEKETETNLFQIHNVTGAIYVTEDFIRDTSSRQYVLLVMALDMGNPSLNDTTKVSVEVSNTNVYPPEFRNVPPSLTITEDDGRETWRQPRFVMQVTATDNDTKSEPEGKVEFRLASGLSSELFSVEPGFIEDDSQEFTAEIWTKSELDREEHPEGIILQILAIDQGVTPKTSTATVNITLEDLNDNTPELHLPEEAVIVSQSSEVGTLVVEVNATDPDEVGQLNYQISQIVTLPDNSIDTGNLVLNPSSGEIILQTEMQESIEDIIKVVIVEVQDWDPESQDRLGTERKSGSLTIKFRYDNPNKHAPVFNEARYETTLADFPPVGTDFTNLNISACDMDCPESCNESPSQVTNCSKEGTIVYSITENVRDIFSIDEKTGALSTEFPFDETTNYTLVIAATDQADIPQSGNATVQVFVAQSLSTTQTPPLTNSTQGPCTDSATQQELQDENALLTYILYGVGAAAGLLVLITGCVTGKLVTSLRRMKTMSTAHLTTPAFRHPGAYEYLSAKTDYAYAEGTGEEDDSLPPVLPPSHTRPSLDSRRPSGTTTSIPRLSRAGIGYYSPPMEMTSLRGSSRGSRELLRRNDGDDLSIRDGGYLDIASSGDDGYTDTRAARDGGYLDMASSRDGEYLDMASSRDDGYLNMASSTPDYVNQHHDPYLKPQDDTSREIRYGYIPLNTRDSREQLPYSDDYSSHNRQGDAQYGYQSLQSRTPVDNRSEHDRPDYVRFGRRSHQSMDPVMSNSHRQQDLNDRRASRVTDRRGRHSHQESSRPQDQDQSAGKPWQYVDIRALQNRKSSQPHHRIHGGTRDEERSRVNQTPGRFSHNQLQEGEVDLWGQFS